jgi:hypothetical protein
MADVAFRTYADRQGAVAAVNLLRLMAQQIEDDHRSTCGRRARGRIGMSPSLGSGAGGIGARNRLTRRALETMADVAFRTYADRQGAVAAVNLLRLMAQQIEFPLLHVRPASTRPDRDVAKLGQRRRRHRRPEPTQRRRWRSRRWRTSPSGPTPTGRARWRPSTCCA